jgi:hypothetical protein
MAASLAVGALLGQYQARLLTGAAASEGSSGNESDG